MFHVLSRRSPRRLREYDHLKKSTRTPHDALKHTHSPTTVDEKALKTRDSKSTSSDRNLEILDAGQEKLESLKQGESTPQISDSYMGEEECSGSLGGAWRQLSCFDHPITDKVPLARLSN